MGWRVGKRDRRKGGRKKGVRDYGKEERGSPWLVGRAGPAGPRRHHVCGGSSSAELAGGGLASEGTAARLDHP